VTFNLIKIVSGTFITQIFFLAHINGDLDIFLLIFAHYYIYLFQLGIENGGARVWKRALQRVKNYEKGQYRPLIYHKNLTNIIILLHRFHPNTGWNRTHYVSSDMHIHHYNWSLRYSWNIVDKGIKYPLFLILKLTLVYCSWTFFSILCIHGWFILTVIWTFSCWFCTYVLIYI
jgi:hypothetical protein